MMKSNWYCINHPKYISKEKISCDKRNNADTSYKIIFTPCKVRNISLVKPLKIGYKVLS